MDAGVCKEVSTQQPYLEHGRERGGCERGTAAHERRVDAVPVT
jgi:hypothetical protein